MWTQKGKGEGGMNQERRIDIYTLLHMCKIGSQWEAAAQHRELSSVLWDDLDGCDRVGRWKGGSRGRNMCMCIADSLCCTAETHTTLIFQLKKKKKFISFLLSSAPSQACRLCIPSWLLWSCKMIVSGTGGSSRASLDFQRLRRPTPLSVSSFLFQARSPSQKLHIRPQVRLAKTESFASA